MIAAYPRWGGGVHVDHLARLLGMRAGAPRMWQAIWQARQAGLVDLWRGWVIAEQAALDRHNRMKGRRS